MKRKGLTGIGILAIVLGVAECALYLYNYFFIYHYGGIGIKEWATSFSLSILLTFSGILILKNKNMGRSLLSAYFWGTLFDRLLIFFFYGETLHILTVFMPLFLAFPFGLILYFPKSLPFFKQKIPLNEKVFLWALILVLIILPKFIF